MLYDNFEVTSKAILDLSSPDAFALFFAKLGYNTKSTNYDSNATKIQLHHDMDLLEKIRVCRQLVEHSDETLSRFYVYLHHNLVSIDYKSLGVRQLGSIYEGLLEFQLRIASEDMVEIKEKMIPLREAKDAGQYKPGKQPILPCNSVYIENDRHERKATGSYYTPDYIVEQTVGPILDEKEKTLLKKFREFEAAILQKQKENKDFLKRGMQPKDLTPTYNTYSYLVDEFFDIKVLDPAMGSGHFLVEAVDSITRRMIKFLDKVPVNPVRYQLKAIETSIVEEMERQRVNIDRSKLTEINLLKCQVLKRCIYGVDLNPMAVELAKVSVWLDRS